MEEGRRGKGWEGSRKKLRRKCEISSIDCLSRGKVGICGRSYTETEKDPGKVVKPVSSGRPGTEGGLEAAMKAFNEAIRLRMISSSRLMSDVKETTKMEPE